MSGNAVNVSADWLLFRDSNAINVLTPLPDLNITKCSTDGLTEDLNHKTSFQ